jgi:hypothetical protein
MSDDGQAMFRRAEELLERAAELEAEARTWMKRSAGAGSLDGFHGLARLAAADGDYLRAQGYVLRYTEHEDVPPERWVSVAPNVLGAGVSLDGDDADDVAGAGTFTVITPWNERAARALAPMVRDLARVDEHGTLLGPDEMFDGEAYTPNFVFDVQIGNVGALVQLDTKEMMWSAMGRTMVRMLVDALAAERIPAHIMGYCRDLDSEWLPWKPREE